MQGYNVESVIGWGGFGQVFRALRIKDQKLVALKAIDLPDMKLTTYMATELFCLHSLKHENIIQSSSYWVSEERLWIDMELMPTNLGNYVNEHNAAAAHPVNVKDFMKQLLQVLSFIHSYGIAHRDLKPVNVLYDPASGRVKIADFGLSKLIVPNKQNSARIGTVNYRAPEVLMGDHMYDTKVDLWAAGCIFSQLLTNRVCFENNSSVTVLLDVIKILGTPMKERWVGVELSTLPGYINDYEAAGAGIETLVPEVEGDALDLLSRLLCFYPNERISAGDAQEHPYFRE